jgi:hypothetical protein
MFTRRRTLDSIPDLGASRGTWLGDFQCKNGRILVKSTGVWIINDWQLWLDIARWLGYYAMVRAKSVWNALMFKRGVRIWFTPHRPRPWYIIWAASVWAGVRFARSPDEADAAFYFEDQTIAAPPAPRHARAFNFGCRDVSKSNVAAVMESVFGYPLAIDPRLYQGDAVEKSELNGVHDGRLVQCPCDPEPGKTYQHVIRTEDQWGAAVDLRTACVGGHAVVVFVKTKPAAARFSIQNTSVRARAPEEVFSVFELEEIARFCAAMKLDWGGLDILRERESGRLYVVDVNKTDTGPAVVLSWRDRVHATRLLAKALSEMVDAESQASPRRRQRRQCDRHKHSQNAPTPR